MTIKERIIKDYPIGTHFRDLVHNEVFVVKNHDFENFGAYNQLYIPVEKHSRLKNQTARIYKNGKFAEKVEQSKFEVGKWYKFSSYIENSNINYAKLKEIDVNFEASDWILDKTYIGSAKWSLNQVFNPVLLTDLSEIQQYLSDTHPDKMLPNSATTPKKLNELKYPDVIHIETEEEYNKVKSVLSLSYSAKHKYYLVGSGGWAISRKLYENSNYTIYEMNQIIFEETMSKEELLEEDNLPEEKKYKYEVVHCTTQEEWDIIRSKCDSYSSMFKFETWDRGNKHNKYPEGVAINIKSNTYCGLNHWKKNNYKILSFKEWCLTQGIETIGLYNQLPKDYIHVNLLSMTVPKEGIQFYYPKREKPNKKEVKNIKIIKTNLITI